MFDQITQGCFDCVQWHNGTKSTKSEHSTIQFWQLATWTVFKNTGNVRWAFAWRRYDSAITSCAQTIITFEWQSNSKCFSGRCIWDWHFSLTSRVTKQALARYHAPSFPFVFPHFLTPQVQRYGDCRILSWSYNFNISERGVKGANWSGGITAHAAPKVFSPFQKRCLNSHDSVVLTTE